MIIKHDHLSGQFAQQVKVLSTIGVKIKMARTGTRRQHKFLHAALLQRRLSRKRSIIHTKTVELIRSQIGSEQKLSVG